MTVGERIRLRRKALKMTQDELAKAVHVTYQLISNYENNVVKDIPASKIHKLAVALQCEPLWLSDGVVPQDGYTVAQLRVIEILKQATPEQVAKIESYAQFVVTQ